MSPYLIGKGHDGGPPPLYDLYAVVNHYGGILGGHYTSFVRCSDTIDPKKNEIGRCLPLKGLYSSRFYSPKLTLPAGVTIENYKQEIRAKNQIS